MSTLKRKFNLWLLVYEEAFKFNLRKGEMAECHISISKLIDIYCEGGKGRFNIQILGLILLFRFYYTEEVEEGYAEVAALLRNKVPFDILKNDHIQSILSIIIKASEGNHFIIKQESDKLNELENVLIEMICERSKKVFIGHVLKSYPLVSVQWVKELFNSGDPQELIKEAAGQLIELNETGDKFIFKKRKQ